MPSTILSEPVSAIPLLPLPPLPVFVPGTPEPAYCIDASPQPFIPDAESIAVLGTATKSPDTLPVSVMLKRETVVLLNAKTKCCAPDLPVFKSGPAGK